MTLWAALALALTAAPIPVEAERTSDLDWIGGYWLSCRDGMEVSETWSHGQGGAILGSSLTIGSDASGWEQMRIEESNGRLAFHARPDGQPETVFVLARSGPGFALFENPDHDFPQRVIYRRSGDRLVGRIEGQSDGRIRAHEWTYSRAALNSRCEPPRGN